MKVIKKYIVNQFINSKLILAVWLSISVLSADGQPKSDSFYKKLEAEKVNFSMRFSKDLTDFFDFDMEHNNIEKWVSGDFSEGRVLVFEDKSSAAPILSLFRKEKFKEINMEEDNEEVENTDLYLFTHETANNTIDEAHFYLKADDKLIVLSIYGNIKVTTKKIN